MKTPKSFFLEAYIKAALWSSTDENDEPLDDSYGIPDISGELMCEMVEDCLKFLKASNLDPSLYAQAGHDFWLTRNGHGAGFWDRPEIYGEERAKELSTLAETFGVVDLYVGDDGRIYG